MSFIIKRQILEKWIYIDISCNIFLHPLCIFVYVLCLGRGSQRLRPGPGRTCNAGIGLDRRHGSLGDLGFGQLCVIGFRFGRHNLWLGDLLHLGLSGKSLDLSLSLQEDVYQSVALGMNLNLEVCAFV